MAPVNKPLTGVRKRQQIASANKAMFVWVAITATVLSLSLVVGQLLFKQASFNAKVIKQKTIARNTLKSNIVNAAKLKDSVNALLVNPDLASVKARPEDTALKVVLDALPSENDTTALATSLQQAILNRSGVKIESLDVQPFGASSQSAPPADQAGQPQPIEVPFSLVIIGTYSQIRSALNDLSRSIRPISIKNINLQGSDSSLRATIDATTYYQPGVQVGISKKAVR